MTTDPYTGMIYMGTGCGEFISYNPQGKWDPGYGRLSNPRTLGRPVPGEVRVRSLIPGSYGVIYGGTAFNAHLFEYDPGFGLGASADTVTTTSESRSPMNPFPSPFNPEVWIPFRADTSAEVTVTIYSAAGKVIRSLELGRKEAGDYMTKDKAAYWDGKDESGQLVGSGVYFYQVKAGDLSYAGKMVMIK